MQLKHLENNKDFIMTLSDRMKKYEEPTNLCLVRRMPAIIRIDGKAFHSFTKGFSPDYDEFFRRMMEQTTLELCKNIQGARIAYSQSDEISILLVDYNKFNSEPFLSGRIQKTASVVASMTTVYFNKTIATEMVKHIATLEDFDVSRFLDTKANKAIFDARVFNIPREDVTNYFIWRQQDAVRNSILNLGYQYFSHKELLNHSCDQIQEKLFSEKDINWNECLVKLKRGFVVVKREQDWHLDLNVPEFTKDRSYVDELVNQIEEEE